MAGTSIYDHPIHLGPGTGADVEPAFTGDMSWFQDYVERHAGESPAGRLVSAYVFEAPWDAWEVHPHGSEVVICLSGSMTLHQERADGSTASVALGPGEYAINEPGTWHTADVDEPTRALFITAGEGTDHRPR